MAFSATDSEAPQRALSQINVTPLVDVMLVLLIIFMVTTPVLSRHIPFELPQPVIEPLPPPPEVDPLNLRINADGSVWWSGAPLSQHALAALLRTEAARSPQPQLQIEAHIESQYQDFARLVANARNAGMNRIGMLQP